MSDQIPVSVNEEILNKYKEYIMSSDRKSIALKIAENHLCSSFDLSKSIGFKKYFKSYTSRLSK
jgi:hypothetical protein